jgi:hypothetical protein
VKRIIRHQKFKIAQQMLTPQIKRCGLGGGRLPGIEQFRILSEALNLTNQFLFRKKGFISDPL